MGRNYLRGFKTERETINIQAPHKAARKRWMEENGITGGAGKAHEMGLELLPGFKPILKKEQGAYAKNKPTKQDSSEAA